MVFETTRNIGTSFADEGAFQIHDLAEIEERLRYILVLKLVSLRQDASSPCAKLCRVYDCRNARFQHFQR